MVTDEWRAEYIRAASAARGSGEEDLDLRLMAIEAVCHAHSGVRVVEHLLVELVAFLSSGRISEAEATDRLMGFISASPLRVGAIDTLEFVAHSLRWEPLRDRLVELSRDTDANFRNRDLAHSALQAFEPDWHGGPFDTFSKDD